MLVWLHPTSFNFNLNSLGGFPPLSFFGEANGRIKLSLLGRCKLWWAKSVSVPIPKVHINGKISIRMEKRVKNQCLSEPYVLINQLITSIWKAAHLKNSLLYMLGGKKISIQQKMTKIGTFENMVQIWSFKSP